MDKKDKNKSVKQFRISRPSFARVIWAICVLVLIVSMLLTAGIAIVSIFIPAAPTTTTNTQQIDPTLLRQLQLQDQQLQQTVTPSDTTTP